MMRRPLGLPPTLLRPSLLGEGGADSEGEPSFCVGDFSGKEGEKGTGENVAEGIPAGDGEDESPAFAGSTVRSSPEAFAAS